MIRDATTWSRSQKMTSLLKELSKTLVSNVKSNRTVVHLSSP